MRIIHLFNAYLLSTYYVLGSVLRTGNTAMKKTRKERGTIKQETSSSSLASRSSRSARHLGSPLSCHPWLLLGVPVQLHRTKTMRKDLLATPALPFPSLCLCSQDSTDYTYQSANAISSILRAQPGAEAGERRKGR